MYCEKCGHRVSDKALFCSNCGYKMDDAQKPHGTKQFRCTSCNSEMEPNDVSPILFCPNCGSKAIVEENDQVKIERIRNQTQKDIAMYQQQTDKEIAMKKLSQEENNAKHIAERRKKKISFGSVVIFICALVSLFFSLVAFGTNHIPSGSIALAQFVLFFVGWLKKKKNLQEDNKRHGHMLFVLIALILIIPFFTLINVYTISGVFSGALKYRNADEDYKWPSSALAQMLPHPPSDIGQVWSDSDNSLSVYVYGVTTEHFDAYISACKDRGFIVDAKKMTRSYDAYNDDGFALRLSQISDYMHIDLDIPMAMDEYSWPRSECARLLPIPKSSVGYIDEDTDSEFALYVSDTSQEAYNDYVTACMKKGFTVGYDKDNDSFDAENKDGYSLSLRKQGFNIMYISIEKPEPEQTAEPEAEQTAEPKSTFAPIGKQESSNQQSSADFQAAMDSYEDFFDEYVAFMKSYNSSDVSMLVRYTSLLTQYQETMEKMDAIDENSLSTADQAYYITVHSRITQKLLSVTK